MNSDLFFTYPSWALRHSTPKVLLASLSLKGDGGLISSMASTSLEGEGGLSSSVASTSLEGEEGLSWPKPAYLCWVSMLEERPAERKVVSSSACLNTWDKVSLWCPRPRRGLLQQYHIVLGVSKHQGY